MENKGLRRAENQVFKNWSEEEYQVVENYYLSLEDNETGGEKHIFFIIIKINYIRAEEGGNLYFCLKIYIIHTP